MKNVQSYFIFSFLFLLSSCGPSHWAHPTKTSEDFQIDLMACDNWARQRSENPMMYSPDPYTAAGAQIGNSFDVARAQKVCLQNLGWQKVK